MRSGPVLLLTAVVIGVSLFVLLAWARSEETSTAPQAAGANDSFPPVRVRFKIGKIVDGDLISVTLGRIIVRLPDGGLRLISPDLVSHIEFLPAPVPRQPATGIGMWLKPDFARVREFTGSRLSLDFERAVDWKPGTVLVTWLGRTRLGHLTVSDVSRDRTVISGAFRADLNIPKDYHVSVTAKDTAQKAKPSR